MSNHSTATIPGNKHLRALLDEIAAQPSRGEVAHYIPELAHARAEHFGVALATTDGKISFVGDAEVEFTIQSISKPLVYALALAEQGLDRVRERVGVEPSGEAFNAVSFDADGRPLNPMINAGAIVTTGLVSAENGQHRLTKIVDWLSRFAGRTLTVNTSVAQSESATGHRNRALAMLAASSGVLSGEPEDVTESYFGQCAVNITVKDLAIMGATLCDGGVNPVTGERIISADIAQHTLSLMTSCGMYNRSGEWLLNVGLPAKSGVGGGILAVLPGSFGVGVFSPPLDTVGNSERGVAFLEALSHRYHLHMLRYPDNPASGEVRISERNPG